MRDDIVLIEYKSQYQNDTVDLILGIQRDEYQIPITIQDQPDLEDIPNFYQSGEGNFWLALHQGQVVGTIALIDIGNHQGALRKMFVKAAYRGTGHGVACELLANLLAWAQQKNMSSIYLGTTSRFLAAHRFYEKNGFVEIGQKDLPDSFPVMKVDTKFYRYCL